MNHYFTLTDERISKKEIDKRVKAAKKEKLRKHLDLYGYLFCMKCRKNDCKPIDVAHIISVDKCQKNRNTELAWDLDNLMLLGRKCHQEHDKLNLKFND